jgi:squalene-associated FAD-dependent desaturase
LPAPFHLLSALLGFGEMNAADKFSAATLALRLRSGARPAPGETVQAWLARWKQTPNAVRALWEPLCLAALNEPVSTGSAALFANVIGRSFLGGADDAKILLSKVGLSQLFAPEVRRLLEMCDGALQVQAPVTELRFGPGRIDAVVLADGTVFQPDAVVSALPWHVLRGLLPPDSALAAQCRALQDAPIVSLHLWLDRRVLDSPFVGLLDSPVHWIFSREHIHGAEPDQLGHVITAVVSGARDLVNQSAGELEELTLREIGRFIPAVREAKVLHRMVYKARSATFAATPEAEDVRPGAETAWNNFFLAGDWTATGLPATIEGAVLSGRTAARVLDRAILA